jgi:GT2 family glycosyltransferase
MGGCMAEHKITTCISSNNNLEYLRLAVKSVRQNAYYNDMPIIVYAENCTDGTNEWLYDNDYNLEFYIEDNKLEKGIGGGMNFCVDKAKTEFVNIIHSDMCIAPNQDLELLKLFDNINDNQRLIASSFRIQPKIFPNDPDYRPGTVFVPMDEFGAYHNNFDSKSFDKWATEFSETNNVTVRKGGGAGFFCRKRDYEWIGGNDPLFAPASYEDMDLFIRMQLEGYKFKMISKSVVWHFSARGSHFRDEAKDNFNSKSKRQMLAEHDNAQKFINKWGRLPESDDDTFVMPIHNTNVRTRL